MDNFIAPRRPALLSLIGVFAACLSSLTGAQSTAPIWVVGEKDDAQMIQCQLSYSSAIASVEAALRYNRVPIASQDDWFADRVLRIYLNTNALRDEYQSGRLGNSCAISMRLEFGTATQSIDPVAHRVVFTSVTYCEHGTLLQWAPAEAQQKVNAQFREFVDECLSEYVQLLTKSKPLS